MNNTDIRDLSDSLGPVPRPTIEAREAFRANMRRLYAPDAAALLIDALEDDR